MVIDICFDEVIERGRKILSSKEYRQCCDTTEHMNSTVASHSLAVAVLSLRLCDMIEKFGVRPNRQRMVEASLCHDLSLYEFRSRHGFKTHFIKAWVHPVESAKLSKRLFNIDDKTASIIRRHMWPACVLPPMDLEGWIINVADKVSAVAELFKLEFFSEAALVYGMIQED